jgi:hypothetical protein
MSKNIFSIEQNGHVYRVVPVEGSDRWYTVTKDGRTTKRIAYDEQGKCKGKDRNHKATEMFRLTLLTTDFLVGDVLVCRENEIK